MKILELEVHNLSNIQYVHLKFDFNDSNHTAPVYLITSVTRCEALTLAIQLICSSKYDSLQKLHNIYDKIKSAKVSMTFKLSCNKGSATKDADDDHSSDSDVPCTSRQAQERARKRLERNRLRQERSILTVTASRNFIDNPEAIEYTVNSGPHMQCRANIFHMRFFTCTDIIFPRLSELPNGNYCNGRWLDLLNIDFIYKGKGENHLIVKFCEMYACRKRINLQGQLSLLTTAALTWRYCLDQSRISQLIYIFQDIRCVFEYISCSEYTVLFLLPSYYGHLRDITDITTNNINFDLIKTKIQLKTEDASSPKLLWTDAPGYVQELFLVAVQLVFGHHCRQNIIFLNNLEKLNNRHCLEYMRTNVARSRRTPGQAVDKNYLQRIVNICVKLNLSCVVEFIDGIPFVPKNAFIIESEKGYRTKFLRIALKRCDDGTDECERVASIRQQLKKSLRGKHVTFHPDAKLE